MRLNKFLAKAGIASRRKSEEIVKAGRVQINGILVNDPYVIIDTNDDVVLDGKPLLSSVERVVILLNKPSGVISTVSDTHQRPTVMDLIQYDGRLFTVGRLDKDTTGALLLTNDGDLAYKLTHPKFEIQKIYEVSIDRPLMKEDGERIERGIDIGDGETGIATVLKTREIDNKNGVRCCVTICLHHGKKREIRRMFSALKYQVFRLKRVEFAGIGVKGLPEGKWRELSLQEVNMLVPEPL
ncbi:MAG: rRNA pseudouridine synthase [Candidatus Marinimicrobia bacterium]|nr:rRNA pseudouridine synthase [Candidatus Neomarinimicrobiota bacterium]